MKYSGEYLNEISFPLGGIGSGAIGLGGDGRLIDWEIFNRPSKGSMNGYSHFAVKAVKGDKVIAKVLNGDIGKEYMGRYSSGMFRGYGFGPPASSFGGYPHFKNLTFNGEFPIAKIDFSDDGFPGTVKLTAFNPFIPLDDKNSSIPGAFFEVEICNTSDEAIDYSVAFSVSSPFFHSKNVTNKNGKYTLITMKNSGASEDDVNYGDLTVATDSENTFCQSNWYRGEWQDDIVTYWNEISSKGDMHDRVYDTDGKRDTCTLGANVSLCAGESKKTRFILTWNVPNNYNYWSEYKDENGRDVTWKNYYAVLFKDSFESACYSLDNWNSLYQRTLSFKECLFSSTLDESVIDAVSANLSVLKSPTVLRLEDGSFYGWEGVHQDKGSCEGTCQHVWNYAYALCFLFPNLERSIREAEFKYATTPAGKTEFRIYLPYGRNTGETNPCLDGQMGTVFKVYREWKISGDDEWLKSHWETVKRVLEYAWNKENAQRWDLDKDGVLEGRQHHTLDMDLFGPSSWLEGMYLLALKAASKMAEHLGDGEKVKEYAELYEKGRLWMKENLFNGEYFVQLIDVKDKSVVAPYVCRDRYWNSEKNEIKYQIKDGCALDQMLAQWHSDILNLGDVFDKEQKMTALSSMMKYNFKSSMRDFVNNWRIYSLNDEAGAVICPYPNKETRPAIPIPYHDETMTGFEYSFAGLLISSGMIDEGVRVVKAIRDRYDGKKRNPWNEIECGSNYARSMASFALLPIFSGFEFDLPNGHLGFNPRIDRRGFKSFWSIDGGWGMFEMNNGEMKLTLREGSLKLKSFGTDTAQSVKRVLIDGESVPFSSEEGRVTFDERTVHSSIELFA